MIIGHHNTIKSCIPDGIQIAIRSITICVIVNICLLMHIRPCMRKHRLQISDCKIGTGDYVFDTGKALVKIIIASGIALSSLLCSGTHHIANHHEDSFIFLSGLPLHPHSVLLLGIHRCQFRQQAECIAVNNHLTASLFLGVSAVTGNRTASLRYCRDRSSFINRCNTLIRGTPFNISGITPSHVRLQRAFCTGAQNHLVVFQLQMLTVSRFRHTAYFAVNLLFVRIQLIATNPIVYTFRIRIEIIIDIGVNGAFRNIRDFFKSPFRRIRAKHLISLCSSWSLPIKLNAVIGHIRNLRSIGCFQQRYHHCLTPFAGTALFLCNRRHDIGMIAFIHCVLIYKFRFLCQRICQTLPWSSIELTVYVIPNCIIHCLPLNNGICRSIFRTGNADSLRLR